MNENPFNITFGKEPATIISRTDELNDVYNSFSSDNPNSQVYILTGIRGSGKTVAMTTITEYYKKQDWICIELNPECDMLEQLASKLYDEGRLRKCFLNAEFDFSFKGIGFSLSGKEQVTNVSTLLKKEFEYLKRKDKRVLINIDEVVPNAYMKVFAHEFQSFLREGFDVCLLMTGLYQNISLLEKQKSLTFLYRAPKIYLGELNVRSIANSYKEIFNIPEKESVKLAKQTNGYAYAYQLLGNILFENKKKEIDDVVINKYDELLYSRAYNIIYSELTEKEKEILFESVISKSNQHIMEKLKISNAQLSAYKRKLALKGIIKESRESVEFQLPRFKEFIEFIKFYENAE